MIIKRLASLFRSRTPQRDFYFYVQCQHCEEVLRGRVDLYNDLSVEYDPRGAPASYFTRKVMVGSNRCYRPIEVELTFDRNRGLINREIKGGIFVEAENYPSE